jgi:hypothetical protein
VSRLLNHAILQYLHHFGWSIFDTAVSCHQKHHTGIDLFNAPMPLTSGGEAGVKSLDRSLQPTIRLAVTLLSLLDLASASGVLAASEGTLL